MKGAHDLALLLLRLSGLGLALAHGWDKVERLASAEGARTVEGIAKLGFPQPELFAWAAALAEFVGGLCITLGLATRPAAALAAFTMGVAAFARHRAHEHLLVLLGVRHATPETLEAWGDPEKALLYLAAFLAILIAGPGRYALDARLGRKGGR